jgi:hydrogenase/urease accessory protein HupE
MLLALCLARHAAAHPEGFSGLQVGLEQDRARVVLTVHTRDMGGWFPPAAFPDYVADVTAAMQVQVDEIVELHLDGEPLRVTSARASQLEVGLLELEVVYSVPPQPVTAEMLIWSKHLIHLPRGHQQLLFVEDRREAGSGDLTSRMLLDDVLEVDRDAAVWLLLPVGKRTPAEAAPVSRISFFQFGLEHILGGYDHLVFLAALLLVSASFREAASVVTCFTVAHSMTLALAALDLVRLSASVVEPLIALSIAYVAVENVWGTPSLRRRMVITFFFGLIHGLGFATALREIGLGTVPGGIVWPLLTFNLGVEAGQLGVAAVLFPLLVWLRQQRRVAAYLVPVGSAVIGLAGAVWFVNRVAGLGG